MQSNTHDEKVKVYEIGYLFVSSIPKEKVVSETAALNAMLAKAGATIIGHEDPELTTLAYDMVKKIHGANTTFSEAYFGWTKFELPASAIESVKKSIDGMEHILRHLLVTTVKENTYLGKRAPAFSLASRDAGMIAPEGSGIAHSESRTEPALEKAAAPVVVAATNVEDMDKSIDAMVKGV
jgi:ribosomal protein S6